MAGISMQGSTTPVPDDCGSILWRRIDLAGHEVAELAPSGAGWRLAGVALFAHEERPCRMEYAILCDAAWRTTQATIRGRLGTEPVALQLERAASGEWLADGAPVARVAGCDDVDLGFSPSTNLLPIRRLRLAVGASAPVRAAWVRFPELSLELLEQVYTRTAARTYVYESAGGAFRRELAVDSAGFVLDYPGLWVAEARAGVEER